MRAREPFRSVRLQDEAIVLLDQTRLPEELVYVELRKISDVYQAIRDMLVRGAPAIGITAAYGLYLGMGEAMREGRVTDLNEALAEQTRYLISARPTAVNLEWALRRMWHRWHLSQGVARETRLAALLDEARAIDREDEAANRVIGEHLASLIKDGMGVLTHCNAGALATSRYGTALSGFYIAKERGVNFKVFADETRPVLQGSRLTAWELQQAGIDVTLICDNMAATVMNQGKVQAVMVGADRIAANGDTANKIGTHGVAVLARHFNIPVYVAAPTSTMDLRIEHGGQIPIEERAADEVTRFNGRKVAPDQINVYNPAFDVTPHDLITAIVTEKGVFYPPVDLHAALLSSASAAQSGREGK